MGYAQTGHLQGPQKKGAAHTLHKQAVKMCLYKSVLRKDLSEILSVMAKWRVSAQCCACLCCEAGNLPQKSGLHDARDRKQIVEKDKSTNEQLTSTKISQLRILPNNSSVIIRKNLHNLQESSVDI